MDPHLQGWNPAAGQQASGARRLLPVIGTWRAAGFYGAIALACLGVGYVVLPDPINPASVIGGFYGSTRTAELNRERAASVATAQQMADAQAQAQAKAQQQVLAAQTAQQYGMIQALPSMMDQMFAGFGCVMGRMSGDARLRQGCSPPGAPGLNQQAGTVMDQLGTTRAWDGRPPQNTVPAPAPLAPAVADGPPLNQGELDRMARLERDLTAQAATSCRTKHPGSGNNEMRAYTACLRVASGEAGVGAQYDDRPRVISVP